jgi:hypothetical protein
VEKEAAFIQLCIAPKMLDARSQQIASAPHDAMHRVPLFQKQFAQIGAVLTGDPGNQRDFVGILHLCQIFRAKLTFACWRFTAKARSISHLFYSLHLLQM